MRSSIWSGTISFGLISIPVSVQSAEQDRDLHFNLLDKKNFAPIQYKRVNSKTGKEVPNDQIVKGYQYEKGHYVIMTDADFKKANPVATQTIDIEDFVKLEDINFLLFERPYYLVPEKGGEKSYYLLQKSLLQSKKVGIAKVVMHTKEHLVCIFPQEKHLVLEILRFAHTLKNPDELKTNAKQRAVPQFKPQELKMAERLIDDMTSTWKPERYKDSYYGDLKKHIDARIKAGKGKEISPPEEKVDLPKKNVKSDDLMALLKKSLGQKKTTSRKHTPERRVHH